MAELEAELGMSCSIQKAYKQIIVTKQRKKLCLFCYEICNINNFDVEVDVIKGLEDDDFCECDHQENEDFFAKHTEEHFEQFETRSLNALGAWNVFFSFKFEGNSVLQKISPDLFETLTKDSENLRSREYRWDKLDAPDVKDRVDYIKRFNYPISAGRIPLLNINPIEQLFTLNFIDAITEIPDYSYGKPIYDQSLNIYTNLLDLFCNIYLKKDLARLDHIDAEEIFNMTPICRQRIRECNRNHANIKEKYFGRSFNIIKFAKKITEKFIPAASWRWIGANHKAHIYAIQLIKNLFEYGLIGEGDIEELRQTLHQKVTVLGTLEINIEKETGRVGELFINEWYAGLRDIREYYAEITIQMYFLNQDQDLFKRVKKYMNESGLKINEGTFSKVFDFQDNKVFDSEFGSKLLDILLSYILSQNTINGKSLITEKIENITYNFMQIFSNIDDPYFLSLKILEENELREFSLPTNVTNQQTFFSSIKTDAEYLISQLARGEFFRKESELVKSFDTKVLKALDSRLDLLRRDGYKNKDLVNQILLQNFSFPLEILNFINLHIEWFKENEEKANEFLAQVDKFLYYFLNSNSDNHSLFFQQNYLILLKPLYKAFPDVILEFLNKIITVYPKIIVIKGSVFNLIFEFIKEKHEELEAEETSAKYRQLIKLSQFLKMFIENQNLKLTYQLPEFDLQICEKYLPIVEKYLKDRDILTLLRKKYEEEIYEIMSDVENSKLDYLVGVMNLLQICMQSRYTNSTYKILKDNHLTLTNLKDYLEACKNNLDWRSVFLEFVDALHIDHLNQLLDTEDNLYAYKLPYSIEGFVDEEYIEVMNIAKSEIEKVFKLYNGEANDIHIEQSRLIEYLNRSVIPMLVKISNFFIMQRSEDISNIDVANKYEDPLHDLVLYLYEKGDQFSQLYGIRINQDINNQSMANFGETELKRLTTDSPKKSKKNMLTGSCLSIISFCTPLISVQDLPPHKRKLIPIKEPSNRILKTVTRAQIYSNRMSYREKNLNLPLIEVKKGQGITDGGLQAKTVGGNTPTLCSFLIAYYRRYKMTLLSIESGKNFYLKSLDLPSKEMQLLSMNLSSFIHKQLKVDFKESNKNRFYTLVECLSNFLFVSTRSTQDGILKTMKNSKEENLIMDKLWLEMTQQMLFTRFKTNIDMVWKQSLQRSLLMIKLHQYLIEDNNTKFKELFREQVIENDSIDRVQRLTTILQLISHSQVLHRNYFEGELTQLKKNQRLYLAPIIIYTLELLAELCSGPCIENSKKICRFIYDCYNGILKRYMSDVNSEFNEIKVALMDYIIAMAEGLDDEVVDMQTSNFELDDMVEIMVNSIKQLYNEIGKPKVMKLLRVEGKKTKIEDYPLGLKDFDGLIVAFESNSEFNKHPLFTTAVRLYSYLKMISKKKSKYSIYFKERKEEIAYYKKYSRRSNNSIDDEDFVCFRFLTKVCSKVEILRDSGLDEYYFQINPKSFYLSSKTKEIFLREVDRTSEYTKITSLLSNMKLFETEMDHNAVQFQRFYWIYKVFGSGNTYYFELVTLILSIIINIILLYDFQAQPDDTYYEGRFKLLIKILTYIQIALSVIPMVMWTILKFKLEIKLQKDKYINVLTGKKDLSILEKIYVYFYLSLINQTEIFVFLFHITCLALALGVSPGFYGIDLLALINMSKTLKYVIKSTTVHASQLGATYVLGMIIMYIYSIFTHLHFNVAFAELGDDDIIRKPDGVSETTCDSLIHCFYSVVNIAFRNGQGVGDMMKKESFNPQNFGYYYARLFLEITFFLSVNVVLLNIIFGIIIDTFAELRGLQEAFQEDFENRCFICNIDKFEFEKEGVSFSYHTSEEHNVWDYVSFLVFMKSKTLKDCNVLEGELLEKVLDDDISWVPIKRSISLEEMQKSTKSNQSQKEEKKAVTLDSLQEQLTATDELVRKSEGDIKRIEDKITGLESNIVEILNLVKQIRS